ncbi:MAG: hypothetical protein CMO01_22590 [Thalassobius sp.]|nr:hypothetical protein [Thalassovita sp.]
MRAAIFLIITVCYFVSDNRLYAQNTTESEYNLMTITDVFPEQNYEKISDWAWRDESQRNFIFNFFPVKRIADGGFVGTYIEIYSKVKSSKSILFLPSQNQQQPPSGRDLRNFNRSLAATTPDLMETYQKELSKLDKQTLNAYNMSLASYLSRYATVVHLYTENHRGMR